MPEKRRVNRPARPRTDLDRQRAANASMPNQTADTKYYRGSDSSVINNSGVSQRRGRVNDPLQANVTPRRITDDNDTDQYYANGGSRRQKQFTPVGAVVAAKTVRPTARPQPGLAYAHDSRIVRPLQVKTREEIDQAYVTICAALRSNQPAVIVEVADIAIQSALSMKLEFAVARQVLTNDQVRVVRFGLITNTAAALVNNTFGAIEDVKVPEGQFEALPDDFGAFVNGEDVGLVPAPVIAPVMEVSPVGPAYSEVAPVDEDDGD